MADVRDILDLEQPAAPEITKEIIMGGDKNRKRPNGPTVKVPKRPEGMHREVFALLYNDNKDAPPLFPSDTSTGYKQTKIKLGMRRPRKWEWMPFANPARTDGAEFHHWRRPSDEAKDYPFARFNKKVDVPTYTDSEYNQYLKSDNWSKEETDHIMDLARRFDMRFIIIADRFDAEKYSKKSVEEIKDRYYKVCGSLAKFSGRKIYTYDADHEKRRKEQLKKLYERTPEQIEEEQFLLSELKKIEARKKERERKTQDLQKLISQADSQGETPRKSDKKISKKKNPSNPSRPSRVDTSHILQAVETAGIKFPDYKNSGVSLRSQRMKLPSNIGQKKVKHIEQRLQSLNMELNPTPSEEICASFNELRSDLYLIVEIHNALDACNFEMQSLTHQYEVINPGKTLTIPPQLIPVPSEDGNKLGISGEIIDVVGSPGTPSGN